MCKPGTVWKIQFGTPRPSSDEQICRHHWKLSIISCQMICEHPLHKLFIDTKEKDDLSTKTKSIMCKIQISARTLFNVHIGLLIFSFLECVSTCVFAYLLFGCMPNHIGCILVAFLLCADKYGFSVLVQD